ncbi:MAG: hypothetical protein H0T76_04215 [Nannocystis sp.]|nr:hypothetical protein [Nannocystis sp.]MBA3545666.1 hypothetical protein [Nannocystis sp.]
MRGLCLTCLLAPALAGSGCNDKLAATDSATAGSTGPGATTGTTTEHAVTTGDATSTGDPLDDIPDCMTLVLPGDPADLALTPRPDRDAEVLALTLDPALAVAPQAHYEVIAGDLAAIRALAPALAEIHEDCRYPDGLAMWFRGETQQLMFAAINGVYRGWDCHNAAYGAPYGPRLFDGVAFKLYLDGVYGDGVRDAYAALPGFEEVEVYRCRYDDCPGVQCEASGSITLTPTFDGSGALEVREYRFESPDLGVTIYRVSPGQPPELIQ